MNNELTTAEASLLANKSKETIRNWIRDFGIGAKIGGRWVVYKDALNSVLDGKVYYENQGRPKEKK